MSTQQKWKFILIRDGEGSVGGQLGRQGTCGPLRGTSLRALAVWLEMRWTQQRAGALGSCFLGTSLSITHMQPILGFLLISKSVSPPLPKPSFTCLCISFSDSFWHTSSNRFKPRPKSFLLNGRVGGLFC